MHQFVILRGQTPALRAGALKTLCGGRCAAPAPNAPKFLKCRPLRGQKSLKCRPLRGRNRLSVISSVFGTTSSKKNTAPASKSHSPPSDDLAAVECADGRGII